MNLVISAFVLLCSTTSYQKSCAFDFEECVIDSYSIMESMEISGVQHIEEFVPISVEEKQSTAFQECYESRLFDRHFKK